MQSHTFSTYTVTASFLQDGEYRSCNQAEILGPAYGKHYASQADAESAAEDLQFDLSEDVDNDENTIDCTTVYGVSEVPHTIEIDPESVDPFDGQPTNEYNCYCQLYLTLDGERLCLGAMIGAYDSDHGSIKASGAGVVRATCNVWWGDSTDHQDIPAWAREAVEEALNQNSMELWRLVPEYEPETIEQILDSGHN